MKKEILHEPFSVEFKDLESGRPGHVHTFFELVYIISGTGMQCINRNNFEYRPGHMFLVTPEDCHSFEVGTPTSFFFLRFNDIYIRNGALNQDNIPRLEYILHNANHQPGCILKHQPDKAIVQPIVEAIGRETSNQEIYNRELVQQLINTLIIIIARNIARSLPRQTPSSQEEKANDILQYIHSNIYSPEKLRAESISRELRISSAYLGRYFKRHADETMQQYIARYKTKLIEHRLQFSDKRINEIADEFGFTDESHLNKFFRRQKGDSPRAYRNRARMIGSSKEQLVQQSQSVTTI